MHEKAQVTHEALDGLNAIYCLSVYDFLFTCVARCHLVQELSFEMNRFCMKDQLQRLCVDMLTRFQSCIISTIDVDLHVT